MRPMDRTGILGLVLVALGAGLFTSVQGPMPLWAKWLIGPLLWYSGFALMLAWALMRSFRTSLFAQDDEEAEEAKPKVKVRVSNFLEHDYENVA